MNRRHFLTLTAGTLAVAGGACLPVGRNTWFRRDGVRALFDQAYGAHPKQAFDLFLPEHGPPPPVVVFVHGGLWKDFGRRLLAPVTGLFSNVGLAFARGGVGVAVMGYRQTLDEVKSGAESLADLQAGLQALRRRGEVDGQRVVLMGHSGGGHLVLLAALRGENVRGVVGVAGMYDLAATAQSLDADDAKRLKTLFPEVERDSPVRHLRPDLPPLWLAVGAEDAPWIIAQHRALVAAAAQVGARVESRMLADQDHNDPILRMNSGRDELTPALLPWVRQVAG